MDTVGVELSDLCCLETGNLNPSHKLACILKLGIGIVILEQSFPEVHAVLVEIMS
jgi:hypothetical protein